MKIKELKKLIQDLDPNLEVCVTDRDGIGYDVADTEIAKVQGGVIYNGDEEDYDDGIPEDATLCFILIAD